MKRLLIIYFLLLVLSAYSSSAQGFRVMRIITPDPLLPVSGGIGMPSLGEMTGEIYIDKVLEWLEEEKARSLK